MQISIIAPDKVVFQGEADTITMPGSKGEFTILNQHSLMLVALQKGVIILSKDKAVTHKVSISGGFVDVTPEACHVLVDSVESEEHLK